MKRGAFLAALAALLHVSILCAQQERAGFPHPDHQGMFPLCTACHDMDADRAGWYPEGAQCASCHDGTEERRVNWLAPAPRPTLLTFDHPAHAREAAADALACESCHTPPDGPRMSVARAYPEECLACHAHRATTHLVDAECTECHRPLATSALTLERIMALPVPPAHTAADFVLAHEASADCQVCHTRERCTSCHVDAATNAAIADMPEASASLELPRWAAHYPEPAGHADPAWLLDHEGLASVEECAACHTRDDCASCHIETPPSVLATLPAAADVQAPGVRLARMLPASHAVGSFDVNHVEEAASAPESCAACHGRTDCKACHDAPARAGFHPEDFAERHATAAYARRLECASCHETEVFCADCHRTSGIAGLGTRRTGYHDAEAVWLLRHGQAARQGLESCVSCHRQPDCLQCHSEIGAFRVNPHGRGFDARRAWERNAFVCMTCHLRNPIE